MSNQPLTNGDVGRTINLYPEDLTWRGLAKARSLFMHYYPDADWEYLTLEWDGAVFDCEIVSMPIQDFPKKPEPEQAKRWWRR